MFHRITRVKVDHILPIRERGSVLLQIINIM